MTTRLTLPCACFRASYLSLVQEFRDKGEPFVPFPLSFPTDDFEAFLNQNQEAAAGKGLPQGFVPHTTFWLIDQEQEVVAVSNLRHRLNQHLLLEGGHIGYGVRPSARRRGHAKAILAATLKEARARDITRCLVTCDRNNLGSARTIQSNGGRLESEIYSEARRAFIQRYWIDLVADV